MTFLEKKPHFFFEGEQDTYDIVQPLFNGEEILSMS